MEFSGTVEKGSQAAGALGFPTINIAYDGSVSGIFAALVRIDRQEHPAAVYADARRKILEAHLLNFSESLYGERISLRLLDKLRDDAPFKDAEAAGKQIAEDVAKARAFFSM